MDWQPGLPLQLETERFVMRSLVPEDATERYLAWLCDADVVRWLNSRFSNHDLSSIRSYITRHDNRTSFHVGVFDAGSGLHIGNHSVYHESTHQSAQINVMIGDKNYWGSGVVLETRAALLDWLFRTLNVYRIWGTPFAKNAPALFNYRRQGFKLEGVMRAARRVSDAERLDIAIFSLLRNEWAGRRESTS